ncbi:hypothetical protein IW261DRAFT_1593694 [Armillaria novae-zelandiae]|uniref:Uncharacterized protein n=1 Tax=Armillaria novae-zelandiae TaxID=153914 RepID=A0AA39PA94_9AGAR|nr:hypothetical protein IW261DRAFT_1593694 [Armillaria novae-zelandiae]
MGVTITTILLPTTQQRLTPSSSGVTSSLSLVLSSTTLRKKNCCLKPTFLHCCQLFGLSCSLLFDDLKKLLLLGTCAFLVSLSTSSIGGTLNIRPRPCICCQLFPFFLVISYAFFVSLSTSSIGGTSNIRPHPCICCQLFFFFTLSFPKPSLYLCRPPVIGGTSNIRPHPCICCQLFFFFTLSFPKPSLYLCRPPVIGGTSNIRPHPCICCQLFFFPLVIWRLRTSLLVIGRVLLLHLLSLGDDASRSPFASLEHYFVSYAWRANTVCRFP